MRHILRRRERVADDWSYLGEQGAGSGTAGTIIQAAEFRNDVDNWLAHPGALGIRLAPADQVEEFAEHFGRFLLIAIEFPGPGEGRGYSQARLLRSRFNFRGELRAVGAAVKQDLLFIMSRCGIDSFELADGQNADEVLKSLDRYTVAYQPAEPVASITQQRLHTGAA